jgi:hypothetical protein
MDENRRKVYMQRLLVGVILILLAAPASHAFEIDGLSSGMSTEKVRKILEGSAYKNIQTRENGIIASGGNRFILLSFCKDELVMVQKHLTPAFDNFVRLIDEKRKELGKPADAWTEPADGNLPVERNAVSFLWRDSLTSVKVTFTEFASNKQLDVVYEIRNVCRQVLD